MPRGGFGRGGFGGGFGMRRMGAPLIMPMGGYGLGGSPLLTTLMAGGLGYMMGSNTAQQPAQTMAPPSQPYPYQGPPAAPSGADSGTLAQLKLLGELHDSGTLTDDEFASEKQRILRGS